MSQKVSFMSSSCRLSVKDTSREKLTFVHKISKLGSRLLLKCGDVWKEQKYRKLMRAPPQLRTRTRTSRGEQTGQSLSPQHTR